MHAGFVADQRCSTSVSAMPTHIPRKRFGQTLLEDQGVIADIVRHIDPRPGKAMVGASSRRTTFTGPGSCAESSIR